MGKKKRISRVTVPKFRAMKAESQRISMLTAYDYPTAQLLDEAGVDSILVGDSMSMVVQGHETTLSVTLDEMIYHAEMVGRAVERALVVVDLPFPSYHLGVHRAIENAGRILKAARCQAVKLEGGAPQAEVIAGLVSAGIPVMAHVGLRPQNIHQLGGYKVHRQEQELLADAKAAEESGAFAVVLECIPSDIAGRLTAALEIPTIGIGAGPDCDGQVLVIHDLLGLTSGYVPKHVQQYAQLGEVITGAVQRYCNDVRERRFPDESQSFR
jgi:3-methyl-2-oxobutanoate hydroxymethyltransferase